jgi:hypothetical protein
MIVVLLSPPAAREKHQCGENHDDRNHEVPASWARAYPALEGAVPLAREGESVTGVAGRAKNAVLSQWKGQSESVRKPASTLIDSFAARRRQLSGHEQQVLDELRQISARLDHPMPVAQSFAHRTWKPR